MTTIEQRGLGRVGPAAVDPAIATVEVVIPVYNEERELEHSVRRLYDYLGRYFPYGWSITIADNASTDATPTIAARLAEELDHVRFRRLEAKGRGRALKTVWLESDATVVAYMDVDLSTDLNGLIPLVAPLISGHSDLAIGSRLARSARVVRGSKREFISRSYNLLLRTFMRAHFSDAQCGFKAMRTDVARRLLPLVEDTGWFFDTEVLVLAERSGLRVHEVPVDWIDDPDSRVDIVATALADVRGCGRVARALATGTLPISEVRTALGRSPLQPQQHETRRVAGVSTVLLGQMVRFGVVGIASTIAYALLYLLMRPELGAQAANLLALLITAVLNTAINRRFTFGVRGGEGMVSHQLQGLAVFGFGLLLTSGSLALLHAWWPNVSHGVELSVLIVANLVATITRFAVLRWGIWRTRAAASARQVDRAPIDEPDADETVTDRRSVIPLHGSRRITTPTGTERTE